MKKLLIFYFALFFSCSANAQFGDLLKGLEKIAKELGGDNQQQSQPQQESTINKQTQNTTSKQDDDSNFIKNFLIGKRWNQERFCLIDSANGVGSFFELDSNKSLNAFLKRRKSTTDNQIETYEKHIFTAIKIIDEKERIYELQGTAESLTTGEKAEIIQHIKVLNDFTRVTINFARNGEVIIRNSKNVKDDSAVLTQVNCDAKEILTKKNQIKLDQQKAKSDELALIEKGRQIARTSGVKWNLRTQKDQLTGKEIKTALLLVSGSGGSSAQAIISCDGMEITFDKTTIPRTSSGSPAQAREKQNEEIRSSFGNRIRAGNFINVFRVPFFEKANGGAYFKNIFNDNSKWEVLYDWIIEITTSTGTFVIKAPPFDPAIADVLKTCS
jgi:hypothetical protein